MMNAQEYVNQLIPPPNIAKPKFTEWVKSDIQYKVDTQTVLNSIPDAFTIKNGKGVQLDRIGEILGLPRLLNFQPEGGQSALMEDDIYKIALQAKILKNRWRGTIQEIYDFWKEFFPQYPIVIQDNQDMSVNVLVLNVPTNNNVAVYFAWNKNTSTLKGWNQGYWKNTGETLFQGIVRNHYFVPKPAGVKVNYSFPTGKLFAWGVQNGNLDGWNRGKWAGVS
jgi:hypothetical protein